MQWIGHSSAAVAACVLPHAGTDGLCMLVLVCHGVLGRFPVERIYDYGLGVFLALMVSESARML